MGELNRPFFSTLGMYGEVRERKNNVQEIQL